jgi:SAM-dependent methyltransferase
MVEVDLDVLAAAYDWRPPSPGSASRAAAAADAGRVGPGAVVLDVGGGRGSHAAVFASRRARVAVVDRSEAMAAAASAVSGVEAVVGDAGSLPIADGSADLVYFHLSIHYLDHRIALDEAWRVCRPGGLIWVWTFRKEHHRASFLARWFPSVGTIDETRFPDPDDLADDLRSRGARWVEIRDAPERVERTAGEWRGGVVAGFVSTLQMLPPGEIEAGLARFDREHPDPSERLAYDLRYCSVSALRPSLR